MTTLTLSFSPVTAVTGLAIDSGVKAASLKWDLSSVVSDAYEVWSSTTNDVETATKVTDVISNTYAIVGVDETTYFWVRVRNGFGRTGTFAGPVEYVPSLITSNEVQGTTPVADSLSVGSSAGTGTVTNYDQWYSSGSASFTPVDDSIVSVSMYALTTTSSVVAGTGTIEVWVRTRLYDNTAAADVPAGIKQYLIYRNMSGFAFGSLVSLQNLHETYVTGFRGLLVPGHSYTLYIETMKHASGGATCAVQMNGSSVSTTGAATF